MSNVILHPGPFSKAILGPRGRPVYSTPPGSYSSGSGINPNEPVGYSEVTNWTGVSFTEDSWYLDGGSATFITDETAPVSPSSVCRVTFPVSSSSGTSPVAIQRVLPSISELYYNMVFKRDAIWQGEHTATNKLGYTWINDFPAFFLSTEGTDNNTLYAYGRLQAGPDSVRYAQMPPNISAGVISRGEWHQWEVQLICNTGDNSDGTIRWWLDGTLTGEYTDVKFVSGSESHIFQYTEIRPVWGGGGDIVDATMYTYFDNYYMSAP